MAKKAKRQQRGKSQKSAFLICLSFLILLIVAFFSATIWLERVGFEQANVIARAVENEYSCERVSQQKQLMQHGTYWVYRNFVSGKAYGCNKQFTVTMHGIYEDIYKLPDLYVNEHFGMLVSFAVYVANEKHFKETLKAIVYVRECARPHRRLRNAMKDQVSFHLYFRQGQVSWRLITDLDDFEPNCLDNFTPTNKSINRLRSPNESAFMHENEKIVGNNIAQLAAITEVLLNSDPNIYPGSDLYVDWMYELFFCVLRNEEKTAKTVFRLPKFYVYNMQQRDLLARSDKRVLPRVMKEHGLKQPNVSEECYPISRISWMATKGNQCLKRSTMRKQFVTLLNYDLHFVGRREEIPLLPEHSTLSLAESSNLRLYSMALQEFDTILSHQFMLHNVTTEYLEPSNKFDAIDANIKRQYEMLFTAGGNDFQENDEVDEVEMLNAT